MRYRKLFPDPQTTCCPIPKLLQNPCSPAGLQAWCALQREHKRRSERELAVQCPNALLWTELILPCPILRTSLQHFSGFGRQEDIFVIARKTVSGIIWYPDVERRWVDKEIGAGPLTRHCPDSIAISTTGTVRDKLTCFFSQIRPLVLCHASANLTTCLRQGRYYIKPNHIAYPVGHVEAAWLLGIAVSNPTQAMDIFSVVCVVCCEGSGLCEELITRPGEFYLVCVSNSVWATNLNNGGGLGHIWGSCATGNKYHTAYDYQRIPGFLDVAVCRGNVSRRFERM